MVRRAVHPILRHLCPRDDLHVLQSLAQCLDLDLLVLFGHERVLIGGAPRVTRLQQRMQSRAEPRERTGLPLLLPRERLEVELLVSRLLRLSRALFGRETFLVFLPSPSLFSLL